MFSLYKVTKVEPITDSMSLRVFILPVNAVHSAFEEKKIELPPSDFAEQVIKNRRDYVYIYKAEGQNKAIAFDKVHFYCDNKDEWQAQPIADLSEEKCESAGEIDNLLGNFAMPTPFYQKTGFRLAGHIFYWLTMCLVTVAFLFLAATAVVALIASGAFGPVAAASMASLAASIGASTVFNMLASLSIAISASVFAGSLAGALITCQELLEPKRIVLFAIVKNFFKVASTNTVQKSYQLNKSRKVSVTTNDAEDFAPTVVDKPVKQYVSDHLKILLYGLGETLAYIIAAFPPFLAISASVLSYFLGQVYLFKAAIDGNVFVPIQSGAKDGANVSFSMGYALPTDPDAIKALQGENGNNNTVFDTIRALHYLMPIGNGADFAFLRMALNPVQWIQSTILWLELGTMTFINSVSQFIEPIPVVGYLPSFLRGAIHGVCGFTYLLLQPVKNIVSLPARAIETMMDIAINPAAVQGDSEAIANCHGDDASSDIKAVNNLASITDSNDNRLHLDEPVDKSSTFAQVKARSQFNQQKSALRSDDKVASKKANL